MKCGRGRDRGRYAKLAISLENTSSDINSSADASGCSPKRQFLVTPPTSTTPSPPPTTLAPSLVSVSVTVEVCEKATETTASLLDYDGDSSYFDDELDPFWDDCIGGVEESLLELECDEGKAPAQIQ